MNKNGFTLIEVLIGLSIVAVVSTGMLSFAAKETKYNMTKNFVNQSYEIVRAVDSRMAIDGYNIDKWNKKKWDNELEIVDDLIGKQLTSKHITTCSGGEWEPSVTSEEKTKLIRCNHWKNRKSNGEKITAELVADSAGFIKNFNLYIEFPNIDDFKLVFLDIKKAISAKQVNITQEISGTHYIDLVSISTKNELNSAECLTDFTDCAIRFSINRNGGNEYLRVDGENSMISDHITFVETKGQSPMKCIRWKNTSRDGTGAWTRELDEECGIGIYKNGSDPVMVDVVGDTGTFSSLLLNKQCKVYTWNGSNVVDSGLTSPCGMMSDHSEVYQVLENTAIEEATIGKLNVSLMNIKDILSNKIDVNTLNVMNKLNAHGIVDFNNIANFNSPANFNDDVKFDKVAKFNSQAKFNDLATFSSNVDFTGDVSIDGIVDINNLTDIDSLNVIDKLNLKNVEKPGTSCITGTVARQDDGALLNCINRTWQKVGSGFSPEIIYEGGGTYCIPVKKTGYYIAYTSHGTSSTYIDDLSSPSHGSSMTTANAAIGIRYFSNRKAICGTGYINPRIIKLMYIYE